MSATELLNEAALRRQVCDDVEFLVEQLDCFRRYYPNQLRQIRAAIVSQDATEVREWAHQLSGSLSNFHATVSRTTAKAIEACGRENRLFDAAVLHPQLEQQITELCEAIEKLVTEFDS